MSLSLSEVATIPKVLELSGVVFLRVAFTFLKCYTNVKPLLVLCIIPQSLDHYVRLLSLKQENQAESILCLSPSQEHLEDLFCRVLTLLNLVSFMDSPNQHGASSRDQVINPCLIHDSHHQE